MARSKCQQDKRSYARRRYMDTYPIPFTFLVRGEEVCTLKNITLIKPSSVEQTDTFEQAGIPLSGCTVSFRDNLKTPS